MRLLPGVLITGFPALLTPLAAWLIRLRVRPNMITATSAIAVMGAGAAFGFDQPRLGALCLLVSGLLDILDGQVARRGGMVSTFGAFFDSTLDRVGEAVLYGGIAVYFQAAPGQAAPVLGMLAVLGVFTGSFLVSYTRARAEGLGVYGTPGLAQRAERILGVGVPTLVFGAGRGGILLLVIMVALALLSWLTVVQRVAWVFQATEGAAGSGASRPDAATSKSPTRSPMV